MRVSLLLVALLVALAAAPRASASADACTAPCCFPFESGITLDLNKVAGGSPARDWTLPVPTANGIFYYHLCKQTITKCYPSNNYENPAASAICFQTGSNPVISIGSMTPTEALELDFGNQFQLTYAAPAGGFTTLVNFYCDTDIPAGRVMVWAPTPAVDINSYYLNVNSTSFCLSKKFPVSTGGSGGSTGNHSHSSNLSGGNVAGIVIASIVLCLACLVFYALWGAALAAVLARGRSNRF